MKQANKLFIASLILLISVAFSSCYFGVTGNGNVEEREVSIEHFSRLEIGGNFDVFLQQGQKPGLRIEADENLHEYIRVNQSGSYLEIDTRENILRAKKKSLYITFTDLEKMELNGAIDMTSDTPIKVRTLGVFVSGASDLNLEVLAEKLWLEVSGAADCDLEGQVDQLDMDLSGAGEFNAIDMKTKETHITLSGAGSAKVWATESLSVEISGAGTVRYKGDPRISKSIAGVGSLKRY